MELTIKLTLAGQSAPELRVYALAGREAIGELFHFDVWLELTNRNYDKEQADKWLGETVELELKDADDATNRRTIHGMVSRVHTLIDVSAPSSASSSQAGSANNTGEFFRLEIVPLAWALTRTTRLAAYRNQNIKDLIATKLTTDYQFTNFSINLTNSDLVAHPASEQWLQYNESDYDFLTRHCEYYGISSYFHDDMWVFVDHNGGFAELEGLVVQLASGGDTHVPNKIGRFRHECASARKAYLYDCDYFNDQHVIEYPLTNKPTSSQKQGVISYFADILHGISEKQDLQTLADEWPKYLGTVREEALYYEDDAYFGVGTVLQAAAGRRVNIENLGHFGDKRPFLFTEVIHMARVMSWSDGQPAPPGFNARYRAVFGEDPDAGTNAYRNSFRAVDPEAKLPGGQTTANYRPPQRTPQPKIQGLVSATVDSDQDLTTDIDDHGRYLITYHFDKPNASATDDTKRYRVRAIQSLVGSRDGDAPMGMHFPLDKDTEVLVAFINGNPDRPIIVGAAPDLTHRSPVIKANNQQSIIRSRNGVSIIIDDKVS